MSTYQVYQMPLPPLSRLILTFNVRSCICTNLIWLAGGCAPGWKVELFSTRNTHTSKAKQSNRNVMSLHSKSVICVSIEASNTYMWVLHNSSLVCLTVLCVLNKSPVFKNSIYEHWVSSPPLADQPTVRPSNPWSDCMLCSKCNKPKWWIHSSLEGSSYMKGNVLQAGKHQPFLSVPLETCEMLIPLVISWLVVSLVTTEPLSLVFGASRAFSFLACLVPL